MPEVTTEAIAGLSVRKIAGMTGLLLAGSAAIAAILILFFLD
jgi:hypothetical protein